ncbi:MAG: hypothetical protein WDW38_002792 [Sanguina aurantia]
MLRVAALLAAKEGRPCLSTVTSPLPLIPAARHPALPSSHQPPSSASTLTPQATGHTPNRIPLLNTAARHLSSVTHHATPATQLAQLAHRPSPTPLGTSTSTPALPRWRSNPSPSSQPSLALAAAAAAALTAAAASTAACDAPTASGVPGDAGSPLRGSLAGLSEAVSSMWEDVLQDINRRNAQSSHSAERRRQACLPPWR